MPVSTENTQISIHALREEGDYFCAGEYGEHTDFYPRPPRGGRPERFGHQRNGHRISIHALREEGDQPLFQISQLHPTISIHALREEGDVCGTITAISRDLFLSTPSARRATLYSVPGLYKL